MDAIRFRFDSDLALRLICGKVTFGLDGDPGKAPLPFLDATMDEPESLDTFGADVREYPVSWTFNSRNSDVQACETFSRIFQRVFGEANLTSPFFTCVLCTNRVAGTPRLDDGRYSVKATGTIMIQLNTKNPMTRGN